MLTIRECLGSYLNNALVAWLAGGLCWLFMTVFAAVVAHPHPALSPPVATSVETVPSYTGPCLPAGYPQRYDRIIRIAWYRHAGARFADRHCRFRALLARESSLRPEARSHADAVGLGQIVRAAQTDCERVGLRGRRTDARWNATCSAWLIARSLRSMREPRSDDCRLRLAELGHVSGLGWVWRGQKVARTELGLPAVCPDDGVLDGMCALISEAACREARGYTPKIDELERAMVPE